MIDSMALLSSLLLLSAALFATRRSGAYLRFAAILLAALALACLLEPLAPGLAGAASCLVLPLASAALALFAFAQFGRRLPALPATLLLTASFCGGVVALLGGDNAFALLPLALCGVMVICAGFNRMAWRAVMCGALMGAAACAGFAGGAGAAALSLLAAALFGLGCYDGPHDLMRNQQLRRFAAS